LNAAAFDDERLPMRSSGHFGLLAWMQLRRRATMALASA
jgi:hypothetical protein